MTREELRAQIAQLSPAELDLFEQKVQQRTGQSLGTKKESSFLGDVAENFLPSVGKRFEELGDFASTAYNNPRGILSALGSLSRGMGQMGRSSAPDFTNPDVAMTLEAVDSEVQSFKPENIRKDPTRPLANIAAMAAPFAGVGGRAGTMSRVVGALDPVAATLEGVGAVASKAASTIPTVNRGLAEVIGVTTGRGGARANAAIEAGRTGEGAAFRKSLNADSPRMVGQTVTDAFQSDIAEQGARKREFLGSSGTVDVDGGASLPGATVDISDLRQEIVGEGGVLDALGIKVEQTADGFDFTVPDDFRMQDEGKLEGVFRRFLEKPNRISVEELDDIKQGLDNAPVPATNRRANRVVGAVRSRIRQKLGEVPGFNEVSNPLRQTFQTEEAITEALKLPENALTTPGKATNQRVGESLVRSFNKGESQADQLQALEMADLSTPGPIRSRAAAIGFQGLTPTDLIGRQQLFQQVAPLLGTGAVIGAGAAGGPWAALLSLPVVATAFVPKFAGSALTRLGAAERNVEKISAAVREVAEQARSMGINTQDMTIGQLLGRMEEEKNKKPSLLGALGASNR